MQNDVLHICHVSRKASFFCFNSSVSCQPHLHVHTWACPSNHTPCIVDLVAKIDMAVPQHILGTRHWLGRSGYDVFPYSMDHNITYHALRKELLFTNSTVRSLSALRATSMFLQKLKFPEQAPKSQNIAMHQKRTLSTCGRREVFGATWLQWSGNHSRHAERYQAHILRNPLVYWRNERSGPLIKGLGDQSLNIVHRQLM